MPGISDIQGREILDSRGNPTVEVRVVLEDGTTAVAGVPSGASTGKFEARELRDGDPQRFGGAGVLRAVENVNTELREKLLGIEAFDQEAIDRTMIALDGTPNKSRLGANAILGISLAACRAASLSKNMPLYRHIAKLAGSSVEHATFPVPMFNILNGGKHSDSGLSAQEFKLIPYGIKEYPDQYRAGSEIFHRLKQLLEKDGFAVGVGDEGGFAPHLESHAQALEVIGQAVTQSGYRLGEQVFIGLDLAANSFYDAHDDQYALKPENANLSRESLVNVYREWIQKYSVVSLEDGLHEEDWSGWAAMKEKLDKESGSWGRKILSVGDDLLVTNVERLKKAIAEKSCNTVLIKPNQIGTLTETLDCMRLARQNGMERMISHRSGETTDDFIADLAVGAQAEYIKTGSLSRGERIVKYNRLLEIHGELLTDKT